MIRLLRPFASYVANRCSFVRRSCRPAIDVARVSGITPVSRAGLGKTRFARPCIHAFLSAFCSRSVFLRIAFDNANCSDACTPPPSLHASPYLVYGGKPWGSTRYSYSVHASLRYGVAHALLIPAGAVFLGLCFLFGFDVCVATAAPTARIPRCGRENSFSDRIRSNQIRNLPKRCTRV